MSVDVEIYMNNIIKFFRDNPKELSNLIPLDKETEFFQKVREEASKNADKGDEIILTQKQLVNICRELNGQVVEINQKVIDGIVFTKFGSYSLN